MTLRSSQMEQWWWKSNAERKRGKFDLQMGFFSSLLLSAVWRKTIFSWENSIHCRLDYCHVVCGGLEIDVGKARKMEHMKEFPEFPPQIPSSLFFWRKRAWRRVKSQSLSSLLPEGRACVCFHCCESMLIFKLNHDKINDFDSYLTQPSINSIDAFDFRFEHTTLAHTHTKSHERKKKKSCFAISFFIQFTK